MFSHQFFKYVNLKQFSKISEKLSTNLENKPLLKILKPKPNLLKNDRSSH